MCYAPLEMRIFSSRSSRWTLGLCCLAFCAAAFAQTSPQPKRVVTTGVFPGTTNSPDSGTAPAQVTSQRFQHACIDFRRNSSRRFRRSSKTRAGRAFRR